MHIHAWVCIKTRAFASSSHKLFLHKSIRPRSDMSETALWESVSSLYSPTQNCSHTWTNMTIMIVTRFLNLRVKRPQDVLIWNCSQKMQNRYTIIRNIAKFYICKKLGILGSRSHKLGFIFLLQLYANLEEYPIFNIFLRLQKSS